jgi:hypothetical protein
VKIVKLNYSRSPWRLVDKEGKEINAQVPFDHPDIGMTLITQPVCGDTKAECTEKAFFVLELLMRSQQMRHTFGTGSCHEK